MIYDELIKRLRETSIDFGESDHVSVMMIEAANAIEDLITVLTASNEVIAKSKPKWIPVTERLPEKEAIAFNALKGSYGYGEYLIGFVGEAKDIESDTGFLCENDLEILTSVTHWMPLPQPPESDDSLSCGIRKNVQQKESEDE